MQYMDRLTELQQVIDECTQWLTNHPSTADHLQWKEISSRRLAALSEKNQILKQQLNNTQNGKAN